MVAMVKVVTDVCRTEIQEVDPDVRVIQEVDPDVGEIQDSDFNPDECRSRNLSWCNGGIDECTSDSGRRS